MRSATINRNALVSWLNTTLSIASIDDYSRNGLQVEGTENISKVGLAVDACMEAYEAAAAKGCQMLVVHHGMIWGGLSYITQQHFRQLKFLFGHGINLYAAHLPLDLHKELGNNARIAKMLGCRTLVPFGSYKGIKIGYAGSLPKPLSLDALSGRLEALLGGKNIVLPFGAATIKRIAVVSGSASEIIEEAIAIGADCYITGEPKHAHHHLAKEAKLNVIYCGHYHSEKPGVIAVGKVVTKKFGIPCEFLDVPTIV